MSPTEDMRKRLSEADVTWLPSKLFPEVNTKVKVGGVWIAVREGDDGTLGFSVDGLTPEQVVSVARGGAA